MMDMLPDGWALIDPGEARSGSPLADISATPGIQRVGVAVQGSDDWHDTVVLTSTDVPDDMTDRQWLSAAVDESSRTLPGSYVVGVTPWSMDADTAIVATLVSIVDGRSLTTFQWTWVAGEPRRVSYCLTGTCRTEDCGLALDTFVDILGMIGEGQ